MNARGTAIWRNNPTHKNRHKDLFLKECHKPNRPRTTSTPNASPVR